MSSLQKFVSINDKREKNNRNQNGIILFIHSSKSWITSKQISHHQSQLIYKKTDKNFRKDFNEFPGQCIIGLIAITKAYRFNSKILKDYPFVCYIIINIILFYKLLNNLGI